MLGERQDFHNSWWERECCLDWLLGIAAHQLCLVCLVYVLWASVSDMTSNGWSFQCVVIFKKKKKYICIYNLTKPTIFVFQWLFEFLNDTFVFFSVLFGYATTVIPRVYTYYVSTALFAIFGIRMLREGLKMSPDEGQEELEEVQAEIKKKDEEVSHKLSVN